MNCHQSVTSLSPVFVTSLSAVLSTVSPLSPVYVRAHIGVGRNASRNKYRKLLGTLVTGDTSPRPLPEPQCWATGGQDAEYGGSLGPAGAAGVDSAKEG